MKLLRTIRLDTSDSFVFEKAAQPGEWAVSGVFAFWNQETSLEGKARSAFRSGFLGVSTLGWSTLVQIVAASEEDRQGVVDALAGQLVAKFGAHTIEDARAAEEERHGEQFGGAGNAYTIGRKQPGYPAPLLCAGQR